MESLLSIFRMHWNHEPGWIGRVSPLRAVSQWPNCGAHGVTRPTLRFMERASTISKSCIGTMNPDVEPAFPSRRGGHRPFQPGDSFG